MFCKNCGTQVEENVSFCPSCGTKLEAEAAPVVEEKPVESFQPEAVKEDKPALPIWKKIVSMVGFGSAIAVALFAFIFMFTAGMDVVLHTNGKTEVVESYDLFYYFTEMEGIAKYAGQIADKYPLYAITSVFVNMVGMFSVIALMVLVTVFSIITIVKGIKSLVKGEDMGATKTAVTLFACFVCMLGLCVSPNAMLISNGSNFQQVALNSAGVTGIVLCAIFLFISVGSQIAINAKEYISKKGLLSAIGAVVKLAAVIVLVSSLAYVVSSESGDVLENYSAAYLANAFSKSTSEVKITAAAMAFITYYFTIALYILGISYLNDGIFGLVTCTKKSAGLGKSIGSVVVIFIYFIFACATCGSINEISSSSSTVATPAMPILSLIFSFVYLAGAIVKKVGDNKAGLVK